MEESGCRRFSIREIRSATKNFSPEDVLGQGGYGRVYKGTIDGGTRVVAVKVIRSSSSSSQGEKEFRTEIQVLSEMKHTNIVSFIGYCADGKERALVYEYLAQGSLADHLHGYRKSQNLTWELRLKILIGAARGLDYLHSAHRVALIHRDVKSSNILLDENWVAKIADFGISKMMGSALDDQVYTDVRGTLGYLDPEYVGTLRLTTSSDVYSFGILLLEVLSGRKSIFVGPEKEQVSLTNWASRCIDEGKLDELIDKNLVGQICLGCLDVFVMIARGCISPRSKERPSMAVVLKDLELALDLQHGWDLNKAEIKEEEESVIMEEEAHYFQQDFKNCSTIRKKRRGIVIAAVDVIDFLNSFLYRLRGFWERMSIVALLTLSIFQRLWRIWGDKFKEDEEIMLSSRAIRVCQRFSLAEIKTATRNFSDALVIGRGGYGKVYKGFLIIDKRKDHEEATTVAIKRLHSLSKQGMREFRREIETISGLQHVNIISLIGYCKENKELILVYELMVNGSLADHLYKLASIGSTYSPLSWKRRLEICIEAGRGLDYLHTGRGVIHRDIKASNILLDEDFVPKLSDFGLAKPEKMSQEEEIGMSATKGTFGYFDPDYLRTYIPTRKSDVYAFGVVLLEVLCGKPGADKRLAINPRDKYLTLWVQDKISKGQVDEIVDTSLGEEMSPDIVKTFLEIAQRCLEDEPKKRPTMAQVVLQLESLLEFKKSPILHDEIVLSFSAGQLSRSKSSSENVLSHPKEETSPRMINAQARSEQDRRKTRKKLKRTLIRLRNTFSVWKASEM